MKSKRLRLTQIDLKMCRDYNLKQAMDYDYKTKRIYNKGRGFATVLVKIQGLIFAIPLRSNMPKKYQLKYKLRDSKKPGYIEGLDIGKTLVVEDSKYLLNTNFQLREVVDYYKIVDNDRLIINKLIKSIIDYNQAVSQNDLNKLNDPRRFKFSTFVNYTDRLKQITEKDYLN
ncbi:hypothetical protein [Streptococcus cuniculi]|uniref:Uncharacterized protein n=1 Tax=Streptococcus cuniculi TaxID=1432788 RepID=A0A4Y9JDM6_9STRE|nr:hypothetical protein [Streptococcus cuniculi]MBF0778195.1 hypothetical protein [Streptococcus cuniculi]TFU97935.1 hypothetical protein E4T82_05575 [Streptococcus cuniculi]